MKKIYSFICLLLLTHSGFSQNSNYDYFSSVTFPANFQVGDYIEFVRVKPMSAGASGNYEISISYTRGSVAAAATHLASISHHNPNVWREVGRVNSNGYVNVGHNFTVDCNTEYGNKRFRIRAVNTLGVKTSPLTVFVKIRSIGQNTGWVPLNVTGSDLTVSKFLPMTNDWSLYVGNPFYSDGAKIAIKALVNGNVGIGTASPAEKLSVNGNIRAKEIKVEAANWPDYVFVEGYPLLSIKELENYIDVNGHLPGIPKANNVRSNGIELGAMNAKLLKKIEELTLYIIELKKENETIKTRLDKLSQQ